MALTRSSAKQIRKTRTLLAYGIGALGQSHTVEVMNYSVYVIYKHFLETKSACAIICVHITDNVTVQTAPKVR